MLAFGRDQIIKPAEVDNGGGVRALFQPDAAREKKKAGPAPAFFFVHRG